MHGLLPSQLQVTGQTQPSSILPGIEELDGRKNYFLFVKKVSLDLREPIHSLGMEMDCQHVQILGPTLETSHMCMEAHIHTQ